jgi:hypothetical protein
MKKILLSLGLFFAVVTAHAQKLGSTVQIETKDNNRIKGKVIEKTDTHLTIETASTGNITIERNKIRDIEAINLIDAGDFAFENQHASRNLMTPTAFGVKKGEGYYKNTELVFNSIHYGITDHFSVGASADIMGPLTGNRPFLMTLNTKLSTPLGKNAAIAGGFTLIQTRPIFSFGNETDGTSNGILYTVVTLGNKNTNLTVGGGYSMLLNKKPQQNPSNTALLTLSGQYRLSDHFALLTENWTSFSGGEIATIGGIGGRYMRKGFAFDVAIPYALGREHGVSPIPYVSVTIPFRTK